VSDFSPLAFANINSLHVLCARLHLYSSIYLFVPDFTGRSFGQIDELFHRKIPARRFKSTVCDGNYGNSVAVTSAHNIVTAEREA
jgi:hypothetical protein